jgi:osmotically inducible protein OsmC
MPTRTGIAEWTGGILDGKGALGSGSGALQATYSFATRFEDDPGTNPEELIAAAHAACFAMALSGGLGRAGHPPDSIRTEATIDIEQEDGGYAITGIHLTTAAVVPDIDDAEFQEIAGATKDSCPVSKALAAVPIDSTATLAAA